MVVTGECRLLHTCEMCEFNNETDCKADKNEHNRWLVNKRMNDIKFKLIIGSNKGGVGKSTVTTNLAVALAEKGFKSVAAKGFEAPGVVVSYTDEPEIQNGKKFAGQGVQIAAGVPLQCDEGEGWSTFRLGLFGLDKLHNIDRTVDNLDKALGEVLADMNPR